MTEKKVDKKPERIQKMFEEVASRYDFLNHFLSVGIDFYWRRKTIGELGRRIKNDLSGGRDLSAPILDVAAGTGDLSLGLYRWIKRSQLNCSFGSSLPEEDRKQSFTDLDGQEHFLNVNKIIGVDFAGEMLELARGKCRKKGWSEEILFARADGLDLPFASNMFSAVTIAFGLRNMADTDQGLAEMVRVCRPGGWVAVLEFCMPDAPLVSQLYRFYFRRILPVVGRLVSKNKKDAYNYLPSSVLEFDNIQQMRDRFERIGLEKIAVYPMTFKTAALYLGQKKLGANRE